MNEEIELGWLTLTDKSQLVVTTLHVFQHIDRGMFGESQTIIPRSAITSVRVGWKRSRWLVVLGTILVLTYLVLTISSMLASRAGVPLVNEVLNLSSSIVSSIQYGALLAGTGLLALFWFDKQTEIHIMAPTAAVGGLAKSYEQAQKFCSLFVAPLSEQPISKKSETVTPTHPKAADRDWQL